MTIDDYAARFDEESGYLDFARFGPVGAAVAPPGTNVGILNGSAPPLGAPASTPSLLTACCAASSAAVATASAELGAGVGVALAAGSGDGLGCAGCSSGMMTRSSEHRPGRHGVQRPPLETAPNAQEPARPLR